ncbi:hypothetical protein [uncultured Gammaproteobacteria bacterium]|nr:hypothetical protein [uncultured Gammaproteobacteria bacterium]
MVECYFNGVTHSGFERTVFRLNDGNVKRSTLDRIDSIVFGFSGNRLSYKMLVLI